MTPTQRVTLDISNQVATITISDEKNMNLLNTPSIDALIEIGYQIRQNDDLRLVILTGGGEKAFIGGADITEMAEFTPVTGTAFITKLHQVCHSFRAMPVPSIARINGFCLGAGMEVAASCDMRIATENSAFGMPETQIGLPSVIEAGLFPSLIGWGKTRELLYTGAIYNAGDIYEMGFLEKLVPSVNQLDDGLNVWVEQILAADPAAIRMQKRLIENWLDKGVAAGIRESIDAFGATFFSPTGTARAKTFLNRKK